MSEARAMEATKHTPGPWEADYGGTIGHIKSVAEYDDGRTPTVARYDVNTPGLRAEEKEANKCLIAAAPDLLEALQRLMANDCPLHGNPSHETLVRFWEYEKTQGRGEAEDQLFALAAIAKATEPR